MMISTSKTPAVGAGAGGIAFGGLTLAALLLTNAPGGNYSASAVADFLAHGHRVSVIVSMFLALLGTLGLISLLAHLRDALTSTPDGGRAASIVWGTGLAAAASFAVGWSINAGQVFAHLQGGSRVSAISPALTYLISEVGVAIILGSGSMLLGFALIVLMLNSRTLFPAWLRWLTLVCGVAGVAGLAFFPFFLLMIWPVAIGIWLVAARRGTERSAVAVQPTI
jgi:hypothetical protein